MPIAFTDSQLEIVMTHAAGAGTRPTAMPFSPTWRPPWTGLGDGTVGRVCREVQRRILKDA
jgi:hypothetical protein